MKVKGKRVLKNGAIAGYVYYSDEKKWKWRIIGRNKKMKGGNNNKLNKDILIEKLEKLSTEDILNILKTLKGKK